MGEESPQRAWAKWPLEAVLNLPLLSPIVCAVVVIVLVFPAEACLQEPPQQEPAQATEQPEAASQPRTQPDDPEKRAIFSAAINAALDAYAQLPARRREPFDYTAALASAKAAHDRDPSVTATAYSASQTAFAVAERSNALIASYKAGSGAQPQGYREVLQERDAAFRAAQDAWVDLIHLTDDPNHISHDEAAAIAERAAGLSPGMFGGLDDVRNYVLRCTNELSIITPPAQQRRCYDYAKAMVVYFDTVRVQTDPAALARYEDEVVRRLEAVGWKRGNRVDFEPVKVR